MRNPEPEKQYALTLLKKMLGGDKDFRPDQWEAIEAVVIKKQRVLVVQRTGWGKSIVYFIAAKILRQRETKLTLVISPLLSLMRNQIETAERVGVHALTIHSNNQYEWSAVENALDEDTCDVLMISPERLNNERFLNRVMPKLSRKIGLLVVDEVHCISDWGHDFRPDYRRIARILQMLPRATPVLGTTATANNRVVEDICEQFGEELRVFRGGLGRDSLRLQAIQLANQSQRLAWLAENLSLFDGSGIVYCLTIADCERVAGWLKQKGFSVAAYHAGDDKQIDRAALEQAFINNQIKILVATVALGMGFDKPDVAFVIHFQRPGSVIAYYQQVGRAGRAVEKSYGILLSGEEDDAIQDYFIESAFPKERIMQDILTALEKAESLSSSELLSQVNVSRTTAEKALKLLELDGAVQVLHENTLLYARTSNPWKQDTRRIEHVLEQRRKELRQMQEYVRYSGCLMEFLQKALDDPSSSPCGRCANCRGKGLPTNVLPASVKEAEAYLKGEQVILEPRKRLPVGLFPNQKTSIPSELQIATGRCLCYYGDAGWGNLVRSGKYEQGRFSDELVEAAARIIVELWKPMPFPAWITAIPSHRHPSLVPGFAERLAKRLGLVFQQVLIRTGEAVEQKLMQNSAMQARNVLGTLAIQGNMLPSAVLLVDDIADSRWTLTMAGYLLRQHGCEIVYPFTLALAAGRNTG